MKVVVFDGRDFIFAYEGSDAGIISRITQGMVPISTTRYVKLFCLNSQVVEECISRVIGIGTISPSHIETLASADTWVDRVKYVP